MRNGLSLLLIVCASVVLCTGCPTVVPDLSADEEKFIQNTVEGLYMDGGYALKYDQSTDQECLNKTRRNYRIQNDDQTEMVNVTCGNPVFLNRLVACSVDYVSQRSFFERNLSFLVLKVDYNAQIAWRWNDDEGIGLIIPIL